MPYAAVNGIRLHYWQMGTGPDLIMLHGFGGNLAVWHFAVAAQLRHAFRITTYDLRGHGRSDMPPTHYSTKDMASDLLGLMDHLGIDQAILLGHSFGADIALHFGLLHPQRTERLIVIDAMLPVMLHQYMDPSFAGWKYWADLIKDMHGVEVPKERWQDIRHMLTYSFEIPILFGPFRGRPRNRVPITKMLTETTLVQDYYTVDEMTIDNLSNITVPVLLIFDENSPFLETHAVLQRQLPNAETALLPASELRHFGPLEQPELILMHTRRFLDVPEPAPVLATADSIIEEEGA